VDADRRTTTNRCIQVLAADGSVDAEAIFLSFGANSATVNWSNAPASAYLVTAIIFGGTDMVADVGVFDVNGTDGGSTSVNLSPSDHKMVILAMSDIPSNDMRVNGANLGFGVACWDGTTIQQAAFTYQDVHGSATGDARGGTIHTRAMTVGSGTAFLYHIELTGFTTTNFDATTRSVTGTDGSDDCCYLHLGFPANYDTAIIGITTPTVAGQASFTGFGHQPQFVLMGLTYQATENSYTLNAYPGARWLAPITQSEEGSIKVSVP